VTPNSAAAGRSSATRNSPSATVPLVIQVLHPGSAAPLKSTP
jgi:hypothetical protein